MNESTSGAVRVEATRPALRCALCHDDLGATRARECADCGTATHRECADEAGGCPTLGCVSAPPRIVVVGERARGPRRAAVVASRRGVTAVQLGLASAALSLALGLVAGWASTGFRTFVPFGGLLALTVVYAVTGTLVAGACRLVERWRYTSSDVPVRPFSWPYVPLVLVVGLGAFTAYWLVAVLDALQHDFRW